METAPQSSQQRSRRRLFLSAGVVAAVVAAGVTVVTIRRGDEPLALTTEASSRRLVVVVGATGTPYADLQELIAGADERFEIGPITIHPDAPPSTQLGEIPNAARGSAGVAPEWFPVIDGAEQVGLFLRGRQFDETQAAKPNEESPVVAEYDIRQHSVLRTDASPEEVVEGIGDAVADWWPTFELNDNDGDDFDASGSATREQFGDEYAAHFTVGVASNPTDPTLLFVQVSASFGEAEELRRPALELPEQGRELSDLAAAESWTPKQWIHCTGWQLSPGACTTGSPELTWTLPASVDADEAASAVVERLGLPLTGDADLERSWLDYEDGYVSVDIDGGTEVTWGARAAPTPLVHAGVISTSDHGEPFVTVDVDSNGEVDQGHHPRPTADVIADFEQLGMIEISGAVAVHSASGVNTRFSDRNGYVATAEQIMLVHTDLTADEVAGRITAALSDAGVEIQPVGGDGSYVEDGIVVADQIWPDRIGVPSYRIEVGTDSRYPDVLVVYVDAKTELVGSIPPSPTMTDDYFRAPQAVAADNDWTTTRWYLVEGELLDGTGSIFRGELDWHTSLRGPDGLATTVDVLTDVSGVEPESDDFAWFEGDDDWSASLYSDDAYQPVQVDWEGHRTDPPSA